MRSRRGTLAVTFSDRLGQSTQNMLDFAKGLREGGAGLRVRNLGGGDVDTSTPMGSRLFTATAALAQMEHENRKGSWIRSANVALSGRILADAPESSSLVRSGRPFAWSKEASRLLERLGSRNVKSDARQKVPRAHGLAPEKLVKRQGYRVSTRPIVRGTSES
ncbi:recombinase family protein [Agreia sp. Leaf283]|uniref:recombinase family protein n=1 Tax=Agreia sp. Leaf283 TaxID=1736321 RepID=UPI003510A972